MSTGGLDDLDREILKQLSEDGRRSFREIARTTNVSERTIRMRVRRLQDTKALRVLAFIDPFKMGERILAFILLRVETEALDQIISTLTGWAEVSYVSSLMGRADLYVQVVCQDNQALWELVNHRLRGLKGVLESETMMEMKVHKFAYPYPGVGNDGPPSS